MLIENWSGSAANDDSLVASAWVLIALVSAGGDGGAFWGVDSKVMTGIAIDMMDLGTESAP